MLHDDVYFSLIHQRTTRTSNKDIEQGHRKSSRSKTYRATLVTILKKYSREKQSVYTSTPSQTVHLLTLLALPLLTIASSPPMQPHFEGLAAHAIAHLDLLRATFYFTSIQTSFTLPHDIHFKVSRIENGIDIKKPSLIVARRTRAAAVLVVDLLRNDIQNLKTSRTGVH